MRLLYWFSHFMPDNLWQYALNSINLSDRFWCASDILTVSFSIEAKDESSTRIFFTYFNCQMTKVEINPLAHLYYLNLETNSINKNTISRNIIYRMHPTDSSDACDCLDCLNWIIPFSNIFRKDGFVIVFY